MFASHSTDGGEIIRRGDTVTGGLEPTGELLDDSIHYDNWLYEGAAGERIEVRLKSEAFDPYLFMRAVDPARRYWVRTMTAVRGRMSVFK